MGRERQHNLYVVLVVDKQGTAVAVYGNPEGGAFTRREKAQELTDRFTRKLDKVNASGVEHRTAEVLRVGCGLDRQLIADGWLET